MPEFLDKPGYAQWLTPYLMVNDVEAELRFCEEALGLTVRDRVEGPDGLVMHAEVTHKDKVVVMCAPEGAHGSPAQSPASGGFAAPLTLYLYVDDVDAAFARARAAGATVTQEPADMFWGDRTFGLTDPAGYNWLLASHIGEENAPPPPDMSGA